MQLSLGLCIVIAAALALIVGIISHFVTVSNLKKMLRARSGMRKQRRERSSTML